MADRLIPQCVLVGTLASLRQIKSRVTKCRFRPFFLVSPGHAAIFNFEFEGQMETLVSLRFEVSSAEPPRA